MTHYIPCSKTANAVQIVTLFFKEVVHLHELPKTIVSNRDVKFMSYFWRTLWKMLQTKLKFCSAFHPQTYGQTEVVSRNLGDLLLCLVGDHVTCWEIIIPITEFAYNSSFEIVTGMLLRKPIDLVPLPTNARPSAEAEDFAKHIHEIHDEVQRRITMSNESYKGLADLRIRFVDF